MPCNDHRRPIDREHRLGLSLWAIVLALRATLAAGLLLAAIGEIAVAENVEQNPSLYSQSPMGWSRGKSVKEADGRVVGGWSGSIASACMTRPPVTYVDKATLTQLRTVGKCQDGDEIVVFSRMPAPPPLAIGACSFDYVTLDGVIPGVFQEVTQTVAANPEGLAAMRKSLPNLRRVFAAKQAGGFLILLGGTDLPTDYSRYSLSHAVKTLAASAEIAKKANSVASDFTYVIAKDLPVSVVTTTDYSDGGKQRRDLAMDVIANKKCMFSIKFGSSRDPNDGAKWQSVQGEFQRIRRVIEDHEGPVAFAKED